MGLHIAVIDPAARVPELDNYNRLVFANPEVRFSFHLPALFGMGSLHQLSRPIDAMIIFGSGASIYEGLPWQEPLHTWIAERCRTGLPTLGICYGHQLIAHIFGGKVGFAQANQEKYKGLRKVDFLSTGFWRMKSGDFIVSHREHVVDCGHELSICASSAQVPCEMLQHKTLPIWSTQFHPEAGPGFLENSSIDIATDEANFASGQQFMRNFILNLLDQKGK